MRSPRQVPTVCVAREPPSDGNFGSGPFSFKKDSFVLFPINTVTTPNKCRFTQSPEGLWIPTFNLVVIANLMVLE